jgi:hypothetical protein
MQMANKMGFKKNIYIFAVRYQDNVLLVSMETFAECLPFIVWQRIYVTLCHQIFMWTVSPSVLSWERNCILSRFVFRSLCFS